MEQKDYIVITISSIALTISIISLIITLIQKYRETKRTIRKTISDNLESIAKANIELNKLKGQTDTDFNSETNISVRRNINSQKRVVLSNAKYLIDKNLDIVTESDCNIMAGAFWDIGDQKMSEYYWKLTITKSNSLEIKIMNLRGFGNFKFANNEVEAGRKLYQQALQIRLNETDQNSILICDTYLMLADHEKKLDEKVFNECLTYAMEYLSKIKNSHKHKEMEERIRRRFSR